SSAPIDNPRSARTRAGSCNTPLRIRARFMLAARLAELERHAVRLADLVHLRPLFRILPAPLVAGRQAPHDVVFRRLVVRVFVYVAILDELETGLCEAVDEELLFKITGISVGPRIRHVRASFMLDDADDAAR